MKTKILLAGIFIALACAMGYLVIHQKNMGGPDETILNEIKSAGYIGDGSQQDFYRLYTSDPKTNNSAYEYVSAAMEQISQANATKAEALAEAIGDTTSTELIAEIKASQPDTNEAVNVFISEYQKLKK